MKQLFVAFGAIGFLCISGVILAGLSGISENCYYNIIECRSNIGLLLFLGCMWILSLASFVGGLANSEIE